MQPYRPPHLRQQASAASSSSSSSANATPPPSGGPSLPTRPLNAGSSTFTPRQQQPYSRSGPSSQPTASRGGWNRGHVGGDLISPAGDIRPMRADHHASSGRSGGSTPNGSSTPSRGGAMRPNGGELDMEMMQSVSRSGGDGAEGDALKDWGTQEQYRGYIDTRLERHYSTFPTPRDHAPNKVSTEELESLTSIVLLFRKLREGIVASHRIDAFAIEVFESSAKVAILANHGAQALASLSGLVPDLYRMYDRASAEADNSDVAAVEGLDEALGALSLDHKLPNGHVSSITGRIHFASLLLLYHLVLSTPAVFQRIYEDLTLPSRHPSPASESSSTEPPNATEAPYMKPSELDTVRRARKALSSDLFDPLKYWTLLDDTRTSTYERAILAWASESVRERAWEMIKKVYLELGVARAGQMLGLPEPEVEGYSERKGATVDNGRLKLR